MSDDGFVRVLREKIRTEMNNYADTAATGGCRSWEEYKHLCGIIQGLALAERHLLDLVELMEKANE